MISVTVVLFGLSAVMFASYGLVMISQILSIYFLRKDYARLPVSSINGLSEKSGRVKIKGIVKPFENMAIKSVLENIDVGYSRFLAIPKRRAFRSFEKKRTIKFYISDNTGNLLICPEKARFIVDRKSADGAGFNKKIDVLPENFQIENFQICEEFMKMGSGVTIIGDIMTDSNGLIFLSKQKNKPFTISQCSDEAFMLIHYRFLIRFVLLCLSMLLTSLFQFYWLFSLV